MIESIYLNVAVFLWGASFGLIYFGGLWLTLLRLRDVSHQALWMISSFFIRNLLVVVGFYPIVLQGWRPALIWLTGFILIRFVLTRRIKVPSS